MSNFVMKTVFPKSNTPCILVQYSVQVEVGCLIVFQKSIYFEQLILLAYAGVRMYIQLMMLVCKSSNVSSAYAVTNDESWQKCLRYILNFFDILTCWIFTTEPS
jgi:hypothetical protein